MPTEFVVPGQNRVAAALDVARTVVRRAERRQPGGRWPRGLLVRALPQPASATCCGPWPGGRRASTSCRPLGHARAVRCKRRAGIEPDAFDVLDAPRAQLRRRRGIPRPWLMRPTWPWRSSAPRAETSAGRPRWPRAFPAPRLGGGRRAVATGLDAAGPASVAFKGRVGQRLDRRGPAQRSGTGRPTPGLGGRGPGPVGGT